MWKDNSEEKEWSFQQIVLEQLNIYTKKELQSIPLNHTKFNSKWINLNVKPKTIKFLEKKHMLNCSKAAFKSLF